MKHIPILTLIITLFFFGCKTQVKKQPTISKEGVTELDQFFLGAVEANEIPGVVAVVANKDQILYQTAFGKIDVGNDIKMSKNAIFEIASMTKPITSVAVMMLYEENRLALDDPISKFIPYLKDPEVIAQFNESDTTYTSRPAKRAITIRHLLSHTSGFGYAFSNYTLNMLTQKTGKSPKDLPLLHEPGSRWTYGMGTRILGELVEVLTGQKLQDYFKEKIFNPLEMNDTFYVIPEEKYNRFVTMHRRDSGGLVEQSKTEAKNQNLFIGGDGGLRSTAEDYITFLQMLLNQGTWNEVQILNASSINLMTENQIGELIIEEQPGAIPAMSRSFPLGANRDKFGLGFQIAASDQEITKQRAKGSYSWSGLFNTHFWVDPKNEIAAVIFMQVLPFYDTACIRILQGFEERVYRNLN